MKKFTIGDSNVHLPHVLQQNCIIQRIFQFCEPEECFTNFKFVCQSWNSALKTLKFDVSHQIDISTQNFKFQSILLKNISQFKSLYFYADVYTEEHFQFILKNTKYVKSFEIYCDNVSSMENVKFQNFIENILFKFQNTLQNFSINESYFPVHLALSSLEYLYLRWDESLTTNYFFTKLFENIKAWENFKQITICCPHAHENLRYLIHKQGISHSCIRTLWEIDLNYFPIKIFDCNYKQLTCVKNKLFSNEIEYISLTIEKNNFLQGWNELEEILNFHLKNLKGIFINDHQQNHAVNLWDECFNLNTLQTEENRFWHKKLDILKNNEISLISFKEYANISKQYCQNKWKICLE